MSIQHAAWVDVVRAEVSTVAETLGFSATVGEESETAPADSVGSFVSLTSEDNTVQIGVLGSKAACRVLAGALMGMGSEESDELEDGDVADGVGELVNILTGAVKTKASSQDGGLALGLPLFVSDAAPPRGTSSHYIACELADQPCAVAIFVADA